MGVFDIKGGNSRFWNFSDDEKDNYTEQIEGTIVEIVYTQKINPETRKPMFWDAGDPKMQYQLVFLQQDGEEIVWPIDRRSVGVTECCRALDPRDERDNVSIGEMLGKYVRVSTKPGNYGRKKPRPWAVEILGDGAAGKVRGLTDRSGDSKAAQQEQAQEQAPQYQQQVYQQPMQQQPAMSGGAGMPMAAPNNMYPTQFQQAQQAAQQAVMSQPFQPQQVGNQVGYAQQVPVGQPAPTAVYDDDIPF